MLVFTVGFSEIGHRIITDDILQHSRFITTAGNWLGLVNVHRFKVMATDFLHPLTRVRAGRAVSYQANAKQMAGKDVLSDRYLHDDTCIIELLDHYSYS